MPSAVDDVHGPGLLADDRFLQRLGRLLQRRHRHESEIASALSALRILGVVHRHVREARARFQALHDHPHLERGLLRRRRIVPGAVGLLRRPVRRDDDLRDAIGLFGDGELRAIRVEEIVHLLIA